MSCSKRVGAMRRWYGMGASTTKCTPPKARHLSTRPASKSSSSKASAKAPRSPRRSVTRSRVARQLQWTDSADSDGEATRAMRPKPQPAMLHPQKAAGDQELKRPGRVLSKMPVSAVTAEKLERSIEKVQGSGRGQPSRVTHTAQQNQSLPANSSELWETAATSHARIGKHSAPPRQTGSVVLPEHDGRREVHGTVNKLGPSNSFPGEESNLPSVSAVTLSVLTQPSGEGIYSDANNAGLVGERVELYYYSCGWTAVDIIAYRPDSDEHRVRRCTDRREHWANLRHCRVRFGAGEDEVE